MKSSMDLLHLPDDLLYKVIALLNPDQLVSFVQTCKTIHGLARSRIMIHQAYLKDYRSLYLEIRPSTAESRSDEVQWSALSLIQAIEGDPQITSYPACVDFEFPDYADEVEYLFAFPVEQTPAEVSTFSQQLHCMTECSFLNDFEKAAWSSYFQKSGVTDLAGREKIFALILSILPNLRHVQVWNLHSWVDPDIEMSTLKLVNFIQKQSSELVLPSTSLPLSRLEVLEMTHCVGVEHAVPFLQLPSLRELRMYRTEVSLWTFNFGEHDVIQGSRLQILRLHDCNVLTSATWMTLLGLLPTCHIFEVSYDGSLPRHNCSGMNDRDAGIDRRFETFRILAPKRIGGRHAYRCIR